MWEAESLWKLEDSIGSPGAGDLGGCAQPSVAPGTRSGPRKGQQVLLTVEISLWCPVGVTSECL